MDYLSSTEELHLNLFFLIIPYYTLQIDDLDAYTQDISLPSRDPYPNSTHVLQTLPMKYSCVYLANPSPQGYFASLASVSRSKPSTCEKGRLYFYPNMFVFLLFKVTTLRITLTINVSRVTALVSASTLLLSFRVGSTPICCPSFADASSR
jgi:hypothetical protein